MRYAVRHATTYTYGVEVSVGRGILHVLPSDSPRQRVLSSEITVEPEPVEHWRQRDFFGNAVAQVRFARPSRQHRFVASSRIEVLAAEIPHALLTSPWETVAREALASRDVGGEAPSHFLFPSRFVPLLEAARLYAGQSLTPGRPILDATLDLMCRIRADFAYDASATDVSTPLETLSAKRRGVCQDFSHWMIAGLRANGVPARYVSGYLRTYPPAGKPRLVGADASHAWVSVWCGPALGWVGLDPTNALLEGEDHICVAFGRDYGDVSPVSGIVYSSAGHRLEVSVDVAPEVA